MDGGCFFLLTFNLPGYGEFLARVGNTTMAIAKYNLLIDGLLETVKLANLPKQRCVAQEIQMTKQIKCSFPACDICSGSTCFDLHPTHSLSLLNMCDFLSARSTHLRSALN